MKKLIKEFKAFINRGDVMNLAVGMIIGAAFTAIVTAVVQNILTPLLSFIPGANGTSALITVLKEAVVDSNGNVITEAVVINWGAVISAFVTFFFTALVLFIIVKIVNTAKSKAEKAAEKLKKEKEEAEKAAQVVAEPKETTEDLLKKIIALLEKK